jgi:hypothetical protein
MYRRCSEVTWNVTLWSMRGRDLTECLESSIVRPRARLQILRSYPPKACTGNSVGCLSANAAQSYKQSRTRVPATQPRHSPAGLAVGAAKESAQAQASGLGRGLMSGFAEGTDAGLGIESCAVWREHQLSSLCQKESYRMLGCRWIMFRFSAFQGLATGASGGGDKANRSCA